MRVSSVTSGRSFPLEHVHRFLDLEKVADLVSQRFAHVRDQGDDAFAHCLSGSGQALREALGVLDIFHEGACAALDVEYESVSALGDFFRKNARRDKGHRLDRSGYVAERVEQSVRGDYFLCLAGHRKARLRDVVAEFGD